MLSLDAAPSQQDSGNSADELTCDVSDKAQVRQILKSNRTDAIIHLAAILPTAAQRDPVRATRVNVDGSLNLLEMAKEFEVRHFVFASSLSIYGSWPKDQIVSETSPAAPEDIYGAAKLYVEQLGAASRERDGLQFVSFRIGRVVGKGAHSQTSAWRSQIFEMLGAQQRVTIDLPYVASETLLLVHVDDVALGLLALLEANRPSHTIYNAPCESVTVQRLKDRIETLNPKILVLPGDSFTTGNPRRLDWSRFREDFQFRAAPILERLELEAAHATHST